MVFIIYCLRHVLHMRAYSCYNRWRTVNTQYGTGAGHITHRTRDTMTTSA